VSGGSYCYEYARVSDIYEGKMYDYEMDELIKDLVPVLKAVEWYVSSDIDEVDYRTAVAAFKEKWLRGRQREVLEEIIIRETDALRKRLMIMLGTEEAGSNAR